MYWKRNSAHGIYPKRVGEVCWRFPIRGETRVWLVFPITALGTSLDSRVHVKFKEVNVVCSCGIHEKDVI